MLFQYRASTYLGSITQFRINSQQIASALSYMKNKKKSRQAIFTLSLTKADQLVTADILKEQTVKQAEEAMAKDKKKKNKAPPTKADVQL